MSPRRVGHRHQRPAGLWGSASRTAQAGRELVEDDGQRVGRTAGARTPARGPEDPEVPTLDAFAPRFIEGYARANQQKPSGIAAKHSILPLTRSLDSISNEQVQRLKLGLHGKAPKTVNNVLSVLSMLLKQAVEWACWRRCPARFA